MTERWPTRATARLVTVAGGTQRHIGYFIRCRNCGTEIHREDTSEALGQFLGRYGWGTPRHIVTATWCPDCLAV